MNFPNVEETQIMNKFQKDFIIEKSASDKILHHGYQRFYPWFLRHLKQENINLLEIGIEEKESIELWNGYFRSVNIHGIDIDEKQHQNINVKLYQVDQSNENELSEFAKSLTIQFDVILDDGSHVPNHQILTINNFWKLVKPGGIYIIEDIETSYWKKSCIYGYPFNAGKRGIIETFSNLIDPINYEFSKKKAAHPLANEIAEEVEMLTFAQNCIILVKKDYQNFSNYYDRKYRFDDRINYRSISRLPKRIFNSRNMRNFVKRVLGIK